jgi:hypothetical protein
VPGTNLAKAVSRGKSGGKAEFVPGTNLRVVQRGDGGAVGGGVGPGTVAGSDEGEIGGARVLRVSRREDEGGDRGLSQVLSPCPGVVSPTPGGSQALSPTPGGSQVLSPIPRGLQVLSPSASSTPTARVLKCRVVEQHGSVVEQHGSVVEQHGSRTRAGNVIENAPGAGVGVAGVGVGVGVGVGDDFFEGSSADVGAGKKPCVAEMMTWKPPVAEVVYEGAESDLRAAREEEEEEEEEKQWRRGKAEGRGVGEGGGGAAAGAGGVDEYRAVEERCEGLFIKGNVRGGWQLITLAIPEELRIATLVKLR